MLIQRALQTMGAQPQPQALPAGAFPVPLVLEMVKVGVLTKEQAQRWIFKGQSPKPEEFDA
jgi:hypothetical protein